MIVYQCEDSLEGIFTAIYNAYEDRQSPQDTRVSLTDELILFAEYIPVSSDPRKAEKVIRTLKRQFGEKDYYRICMALASPNPEKAQAVYQTVADGLARKCRPGHLLDNLANDQVNLVLSMEVRAGREYDHLRGFLRFEELEEGILYAQFSPKNNLLTFLMEHFADRFPIENFMIYDEGRQQLGIHPAGGNGKSGSEWYLMQCGEKLIQTLSLASSDEEKAYQELFRCFCHKIAIKERRNLELQRNMLPLRFREYMTEFN